MSEMEENVLENIDLKELVKDRRKFIGGSDAPVILGVSSWKTPFELFQEKTGQKEPEDLSDVERVVAGILMEDVVAQMYTRRTGKKTRRMNDRRIHMQYGFPMGAQIDRMIVGDAIPLEIKTADISQSDKWGEEGTDDIPLPYYCQVQHQMAVLGKDRAEVAVLIGGNRLKLYVVPFHADFASQMIDAELTFWQACESGISPDPVSVDEASLKWSRGPSSPVYGTTEDGLLAARYKEIADQVKALEAAQDEVKLALQKRLADLGDTLVVDGIPVCSWKNQTSNRLDTKAIQAEMPDVAKAYTKPSESRVFRIAKGADNFRRAS